MKLTTLATMLLLLSGICIAQTTYYQNQQYQFRGTAQGGQFTLFGSEYTAQNGSEIDLPVLNSGNGACNQQNPPFIGYVYDDGANCAPITKITLGQTIPVITNGRTCTGPSSVHIEWDHAIYDATFTFVFQFGRLPGCYTKTLTGQVVQ